MLYIKMEKLLASIVFLYNRWFYKASLQHHLVLVEFIFGFAVILFAILFEPISILIGIPQNALSRKAEYKADAFF